MNNFTSFPTNLSYSFGAAPPLPISSMPPSKTTSTLMAYQQHMLRVLATLESEISQHVTELTQFVHIQTEIDSAQGHALGEQ